MCRVDRCQWTCILIAVCSTSFCNMCQLLNRIVHVSAAYVPLWLWRKAFGKELWPEVLSYMQQVPGNRALIHSHYMAYL